MQYIKLWYFNTFLLIIIIVSVVELSGVDFLQVVYLADSDIMMIFFVVCVKTEQGIYRYGTNTAVSSKGNRPTHTDHIFIIFMSSTKPTITAITMK